MKRVLGIILLSFLMMLLCGGISLILYAGGLGIIASVFIPFGALIISLGLCTLISVIIDLIWF